jgi:hypothetical protein
MGSVLAVAYQVHLHVDGSPSAAATAARQGISGGVVIADQLGAPWPGHAVRAALVHGMDISLLASAGIAVTGSSSLPCSGPRAPAHDNTQTPMQFRMWRLRAGSRKR